MVKRNNRKVQETENIFVKKGLIVIAIFVVAVYSQVISFSFTGFDDDFLVVKNLSALNNWDNINKIFTDNSFLSDAVYGFYRPLQTLSFMIDTEIGGGELWAFHLSSFILHLLCCYLLYFLLMKLKISKPVTFILTLIFAVHSLFSINVAWLPARGDLLLSVFGLSGFLFYLFYVDTKKIQFLIFHFLAVLFALFSKESAVVLPVIFLTYYLFTYKKFENILIFPIISWLIAGFIWYILRSNSIIELPDEQLFGFVPFIQNLQTIPEYFAKFILPYKIMALPIFRIDITLIGLIAILLLLVYIIKNKKSLSNLYLFGFIWFLLLILPGMFYSRLDENPQYFYQYLDHRAYFALIGILLVLSQILNDIYHKLSQKTFIIFGIVATIIFSLLSFNLVKIYSNPDTFLNQAIEDNPSAAVAYFLLGNVKKDEMNYDDAIRMYSEAIKINAKYAEALNNRGSLLAMMSIFDRAINDLSKAIEINPQIPDGYFNRALSYESIGKYNEAILDYKKALELQPNDFSIKLSVANCHNSTGDFQTAINIYSEILSLKADYYEAYYNRANTYSALKNSPKAIEDYNSAIRLNPNYVNAFLNRANEKYRMGDKQGACTDWVKAMNLGSNPAGQMLEKYCR